MKDYGDAGQLLACRTPDEWLAAAPEHLGELLIDHANCERKAALTALGLIHRYPEHGDLVFRMSRLAREELRHFEQVMTRMAERGIPYRSLSPSRYGAALNGLAAKHEPLRLIDSLLVGALIEARSWERFRSLVAVVDKELGAFYQRLLDSERRHFVSYLKLARRWVRSPRLLEERLERLVQREAELIMAPDPEFRFHSGVPS